MATGWSAALRLEVVRTSLHAQPASNLLIQLRDFCVVKVLLAQLALEQEAVMFPQGALHRLGQFVALAPHASPRQLG